jgi:pimeloyl-ACP methyl ester carboxylesterase
MRSAIIGFFLGAMMVALSVAAFQQWVIRAAVDDFDYHFAGYVFSDTKFPWGYLVDGRVIKRCLFPVTVTTTFYDAQYNEVAEADKPGRYGAVVKIAFLGGVVKHRFITLYRTPEPVYWGDGPAPATVSAQLPLATGIDPVVLQKQASEIGSSINSHFFGSGDVSSSLAVILAGLSETSPNDPPAVGRTSVESRDANWWFELRRRLGLIKPYAYLVDLPSGYDADPAKKWPVILYLHSGFETGHDLSMVRHSGLAGEIAKGRQVPAIVVSPQSPAGQYWNYRILLLLLDEISAKYRVDPARVYLAGVSMGGDAVWEFALAHPERFAAMVAIAGESDPADCARLKDLPVWDFQGEKDPIVPTTNPIAVVNAVRQFGGHAHLTLYPDAGHSDAWARAFADEDLYTWLLAQKRGQPEVITPGVPSP